jgi:hypothetical protein
MSTDLTNSRIYQGGNKHNYTNSDTSPGENNTEIKPDGKSEDISTKDHNVNNINNHNSSSLNEDELMVGINKEAENLSDNININNNDINIYNKYDHLSDDALKDLIKEKK